MSADGPHLIGDLEFEFSVERGRDGKRLIVYRFVGPAGGIGLVLLPDQAQDMVDKMQLCIDEAKRPASQH
jgi:hypothetical protein